MEEGHCLGVLLFCGHHVRFLLKSTIDAPIPLLGLDWLAWDGSKGVDCINDVLPLHFSLGKVFPEGLPFRQACTGTSVSMRTLFSAGVKHRFHSHTHSSPGDFLK